MKARSKESEKEKKPRTAMPENLGELTQSRSIRFTDAEWKAANACGLKYYGGAGANCVIRTALRKFLSDLGFL